MKNTNNKKSFTLIELLVVIAIIGILSTLVIARFSDWGDNARIANTLQWSAGVHRTLGANLVGHWPLNEGSGTIFNDISGYGNHGDCEGDYCPSWTEDDVPGTGNHALSFDGVNDYVNIGTDESLDIANAITISAWAKPNPTETVIGIVGRHVTGENASGTVRISANEVVIVIKIGGSYDSLATTTDPITENKWHQVMYIYDGSNEYIYVNGVEEIKRPNSGVIYTPAPHNYIGATYGETGQNFNGKINDVRIYDTAFTAEEVGRIYAESKDKYLAYE